ncbi:hypothetical protein [Streptomyces sp.]|uniref:MmyB family transcriptional regulator n=1 Tax=Streptomyces sp. TaxID=1931 RepID=UPI0028122C0A|nr:hypothetical protein [Streptomyces sp.]
MPDVTEARVAGGGHDPGGSGEAVLEFARHWAAGTAARHTADRKTIGHPEVGDIVLDCDVLLVPGADLRVVTYTAAAGGGEAGPPPRHGWPYRDGALLTALPRPRSPDPGRRAAPRRRAARVVSGRP